jgi:hypothetical protein
VGFGFLDVLVVDLEAKVVVWQKPSSERTGPMTVMSKALSGEACVGS